MTDRPRRFVVFGLGRTGSTLLTELLDAHPSIQCDGEILWQRVAFPKLYVAGRAMTATKPVYGFKLLTNQIRRIQPVDPDAFMAWLVRRGYRVIYVQRRDTLRLALSQMNARVNGYHHREAGGGKRSVRIDPAALRGWLDGMAESAAFNDALLAPYSHLPVVYEEDLVDTAAQRRTVERVCDALDVPYQDVSTDLVRGTPANLTDLIENYDEIAQSLAAPTTSTSCIEHLPRRSTGSESPVTHNRVWKRVGCGAVATGLTAAFFSAAAPAHAGGVPPQIRHVEVTPAPTSVTITGQVNSGGLVSHVKAVVTRHKFREVTPAVVVDEASWTPVHFTLNGLKRHKAYRVKIVVRDTEGKVSSGNRKFTTR
jgi:LPS sulfotransferase NodH